MSVSWKVQIDRGKLWFEVRGALANIVLVGLLALFVPSLHATLDEFVVGVVFIFVGVVLVGAIHLVYAAIHMGVICLTAPHPTNTAESSRHHVLGVGDPAYETTQTVWWEHDASTK